MIQARLWGVTLRGGMRLPQLPTNSTAGLRQTAMTGMRDPQMPRMKVSTSPLAESNSDSSRLPILLQEPNSNACLQCV